MVECGANEVPEDVMAEALEFGHKSLQPLIDTQLQMAQAVGKAKREPTLFAANEKLAEEVHQRVKDQMNGLLDRPLGKAEFYAGMDALQDARGLGDVHAFRKGLTLQRYPAEGAVKTAFGEAEHRIVRERILSAGKRPDGRSPAEIRPIWCEIGLVAASTWIGAVHTWRDAGSVARNAWDAG